MSSSPVSIADVFEQLRLLRDAVTALAASQAHQAGELAGHQTTDTDEAIHLSFAKLHDQIGSMEETLATVAEATGQVPKL